MNMYPTFRAIFNWYSKLSPKKPPIPPHLHIVQFGDPVLRQSAQAISPALIKLTETKKLISNMKTVMESYGSCGISAPQIGISKRVMILEFNDFHKQQNEKYLVDREMSNFPLTIIINPVIKPTSNKKVVFEEACESIRGFTALVPRYREIQITGYNENANEIQLNLKGWIARIAQHELDHLDAKAFTDIMIKESFQCMCWKEVNEYSGKITLPFRP